MFILYENFGCERHEASYINECVGITPQFFRSLQKQQLLRQDYCLHHSEISAELPNVENIIRLEKVVCYLLLLM
jgi:hypothetical protein